MAEFHLQAARRFSLLTRAKITRVEITMATVITQRKLNGCLGKRSTRSVFLEIRDPYPRSCD
jgi:hypothetical protein